VKLQAFLTLKFDAAGDQHHALPAFSLGEWLCCSLDKRLNQIQLAMMMLTMKMMIGKKS
jgi:hypothetical protein